MRPQDELDKWLHEIGRMKATMNTRKFAFQSTEELVLTYGLPDSDEPFTPKEEEEISLLVSGSTYRQKDCFSNAWNIVQDAHWRGVEGFHYAEGFGLSHNLPLEIHHAVVLYHGKVIDLTWRDDYTRGNYVRSGGALVARARENRRSNVYRVIPVHRLDVAAIMVKTGVYGQTLTELAMYGLPPQTEELVKAEAKAWDYRQMALHRN